MKLNNDLYALSAGVGYYCHDSGWAIESIARLQHIHNNLAKVKILVLITPKN